MPDKNDHGKKGAAALNVALCTANAMGSVMSPRDGQSGRARRRHREARKPAELHVPAGKPFFLVVSNEEDTPDEFEANSPPLEKVILPGSQGRIRVRPLAPGRFTFFDDFHPGTPRGVIVAE
jgi:hypothetical protein